MANWKPVPDSRKKRGEDLVAHRARRAVEEAQEHREPEQDALHPGEEEGGGHAALASAAHETDHVLCGAEGADPWAVGVLSRPVEGQEEAPEEDVPVEVGRPRRPVTGQEPGRERDHPGAVPEEADRGEAREERARAEELARPGAQAGPVAADGAGEEQQHQDDLGRPELHPRARRRRAGRPALGHRARCLLSGEGEAPRGERGPGDRVHVAAHLEGVGRPLVEERRRGASSRRASGRACRGTPGSRGCGCDPRATSRPPG